MGGADKADLRVGETTMLERVASIISPHCDPIALIGRSVAPAPFIALGDSVSGHEGPLSGILAALRWAKTEFVMICPCDAPFLPLDLVPRLLARAKGVGVVIAATGQQDHPTISLWRTDLSPALAEAFAAGTRSIRAFTKTVPTAMVSWHGAGYDPFFNVNKPEDLAAAERLAERLA
jgi:molybdopterin-guanine dinucleotide biosynthesis protein A